MSNKVQNMLAWFLLIWGLLFFVITTISKFFKIGFLGYQ